jgi:hypothetical protein
MTDADQSFRVDMNDFLGVNHRKFVLRMREMLRNDPSAYSNARAACTKSLTNSMVRAAQNAVHFLLTEGSGFKLVNSRGQRDGECFFGKDGEDDIKPNYPQQSVLDISMKIAQTNADCMKAQIKMLFPTLEEVEESERLEKLEDERHARFEAAMEQKAQAKAQAQAQAQI